MKFTNNRPVSAPGGGRRAAQPFRYPMAPPPEPPAPPPPEPTDPSAAMVTFAADWRALAEPTHDAMFRDANHQREMLALTGTIATRTACTHVAVQDGNWTDAKTWLVVSSGLFGLPGTGAIIGVPAGITVTMDNNTTTVFNRMRVDGKVTFAINQDTKLYIDDTIVVNHGGEWLHGTVANPIPAAYTSEVVFPSQTNLDGAKEKLLLQRGFLGMGANSMHPDGKIHIHGASKDHWGTTSATVAVGATSVVLDAAPTGWAIGDSIHLMPTNVYGWMQNFSTPRTFTPHQGDNVTITDITGSTVTFTPATTYSHSAASATAMTDLKWYVVNFTRNVQYYSPVDTPVHQRGHWMGMGDGIDVRWASFDWLGRTRKGFLDYNFDATSNTARIAENGGTGDPDFTPTDNVRGRYNFHIHRSGVEIGQPFATVTGIACTEAEGWLIAHHQSNVNFDKCVGRNFLGSGMVSEDGSEGGTWSNCYMGQGKQQYQQAGATADKGEYKSFTELDFGINRKYHNDFGRNNNCYWFRSRGIVLDGLVAAGAERGMVWNSRGGIQKPTVADLPYDSRIFYGRAQLSQSVDADDPILLVSNCKVVGVTIPLLVIKTRPKQDHELRTHIHSNDFWNNGASLEFEYTGNYTIENNRFHRTGRGVNLRFAEAIRLAAASAGFYISDNVINGYPVFCRRLNKNTRFPTDDAGNVIVDNQTTTATLRTFTTTTIDSLLRIEDPADLSGADPTFVPSEEPVFPNSTLHGSKNFTFVGALTTEFETRDRMHERARLGISGDDGLTSTFKEVQAELMLSRYGFYTFEGNNYLLVPDLISKKLPTTPGGTIPTRFLTVPVQMTQISMNDYEDKGAMPQRYADCILIGRGTPPGTPDPSASNFVVYEDILGVGGLYEGL